MSDTDVQTQTADKVQTINSRAAIDPMLAFAFDLD